MTFTLDFASLCLLAAEREAQKIGIYRRAGQHSPARRWRASPHWRQNAPAN